MKWLQYWTHSEHTLNTLWTHSEHTLKIAWWFAQDLTKSEKHSPLAHSLSNMDPRDASASKNFHFHSALFLTCSQPSGMRLFQVRSAKLKQRSSAPRFLRSNVHRWDFASLSPWSWRSCARWRGPSARRSWASAPRRSAALSLTRSAGSRPRLSKCLRSRSNWSVSHFFYSRHFAIFKSYHLISIVLI